MRRFTLPVLLLGFACLAFAQRSVEFEGRYWVTRSDSQLRIDKSALGTEIDLDRDLGIKDANFPAARFRFQGAGRSSLRFGYTPMSYSGDQTVSRTVFFRGQAYQAQTQVVSDLEIQHLELGWAYQFINAGEGRFKLGSLIKAHGFLTKARLRAPILSPPIDQKGELPAGIPTIGIALDANPHDAISIYAEISGMPAGKYGYFVGSDFGVKVSPVRNLFLTAGYRTFDLHAKNQPDFARIQIRGPVLGGGFRF